MISRRGYIHTYIRQLAADKSRAPTYSTYYVKRAVLRHDRQIFWQRSKRVLLSPEFFSRSGRAWSCAHVRMYPYMFFSCTKFAISCSPTPVINVGVSLINESRARFIHTRSWAKSALIDQGRNVRFRFAFVRTRSTNLLLCRSHYARHACVFEVSCLSFGLTIVSRALTWKRHYLQRYDFKISRFSDKLKRYRVNATWTTFDCFNRPCRALLV